MSIVIPVHLRIVRCHQIKKRHQYDCCSWRYLQSWRKSFPWSGETHHGKPSVDEEVKKLKAESQLVLRLWDLWQYLCTKAVIEIIPFCGGAVQALIRGTGKTLNQLSWVSWVSLHRCLLILSLAFQLFLKIGVSRNTVSDILFLELSTRLEL